MRGAGIRGSLACFSLVAVACSSAAGTVVEPDLVRVTASPSPTPTVRPTPPPIVTPPAQRPAVAAAAPRSVREQAYVPFATVGPLTLHHPSKRVERIGLHQSNHEGAQELTVLPTAVSAVTLESRDRLSSLRSAADIVSDPAEQIRAPVTGRVKRAGTYVLYCEHSDDFVVIEPDGRPGWEIKLLHIDGVQVRSGDRVVAGQTVLAPRPTKLPFESQVDEIATAEPWPHVHLEVVDPSIPDRPNPGSGGC